MSEKRTKLELRELEGLIGHHPEGMDAIEIREEIGFKMKDRTLQRRLQRLSDQERIRREGWGRGSRYYPMGNHVQDKIEPAIQQLPEYLSQEGLKIVRQMRKPVSERMPAGYRAELLDDYEPNVSFYLSAENRGMLAEQGRVGKENLPAGTYLRMVMDRLLIDLSWNSSRLEGNTYSLLDTQRLLDQGENVEGKNAEETQMILNHKAAIEMLADDAEEIGFNRYTICNLHASLSENLLPDPRAGGRLRSLSVGIGGSVYEPLQVPQRIEEEFERMLAKADAIRDPFEQSFFIMAHLPYLQPFDDVNKRCSRLAANIPLIQRNLCPLSFVDVDRDVYTAGILGVYELGRFELLRDVFIWAYQRSCSRYAAIRQSIGQPDRFRLRYREPLGTLVKEVVTRKLNKANASAWIEREVSQRIPEQDRERFQEIVETELSSLHPGNFARYRIKPLQFEAWEDVWKS